jgi:hypothetical protein
VMSVGFIGAGPRLRRVVIRQGNAALFELFPDDLIAGNENLAT